jgi:hypothetical protein
VSDWLPISTLPDEPSSLEVLLWSPCDGVSADWMWNRNTFEGRFTHWMKAPHGPNGERSDE